MVHIGFHEADTRGLHPSWEPLNRLGASCFAYHGVHRYLEVTPTTFNSWVSSLEARLASNGASKPNVSSSIASTRREED